MSARFICAFAICLISVGCADEPQGVMSTPQPNEQEALENEIEASGISVEDYQRGMSAEQSKSGQ